MLIDSQNIWHLYLEGAAEDMMNNILRKNNVPQELHDLFLSKENNKLVFKTDDVPLLYKWIQNENADARTLKDDYTNYQKFFGNTPLTNFTSYLDFTEKVHAKRDEADYLNRNKNVGNIELEGSDKENIIENNDEILILKGDDEHKCVKYGKGYSFCISRGGGGNMYGNYRLSKASTFYFVFFKNIPKEDERHIMVLDRTDSGWEWTFGKNQTKVVQGGWDEIIKEFPILAKYEDKFVNKPLTPEEEEYQNKLRRFTVSPSLEKFNTFSYKEKSDVLKFGMLIPLDLFESLDKYLRNEWVSVGPKMSDSIYELLNDKEKERFFTVRKQQLNVREIEDKFDVEICRNDEVLYEKYIKPDKELCDEEEKQIQSMIVDGVSDDIFITCKYHFPNLDNLKKCGNINATSAQTLSLPQLQKSGNIDATSAQTLSLPQLQESGNIYAYSAQTLSLPQLQKSGNIDAASAQTLSLPQLQESGNIYAKSAQTLSLPQLQKSGTIRKSGAIHAYSAQTLSLPQLQESGNIYANSAQTLSLPQLQKSETIHATSAQTLSLPQLQKSETINATSAQTLSLPQLQKSGNIYATSAQKIIISKHLINKIVKKRSDVEIIDPSEPQELNDSVIYNLMKSFLLKS